MRQSGSAKRREDTVAIYLRISREDGREDESYSIASQRRLLTGEAKRLGFTNLLYFVDDGISGTRRDRQEFVRMLGEIEKGYISTVMVKDLSRLARDHIHADTLIEETFPENDVRFIAVSEGLDTANGEDDFTPFRNLMNEWYARDISKKLKLSNAVKGNAGVPLSRPPYGYMNDPDNPTRWIVEKEAAQVVRRIYDMSLEGKGTEQIAATLSAEGVLTPQHYWRSRGVNRPGTTKDDEPCRWNASTIVSILSKQEYCGDVVNFKTFSKSFKLKKRVPNKKENMAVFENVHEPIIERATWERIQEKRGTVRKRKTKSGEKNMFSGLLVCADCGHNLWFHFNQKNPEIRYFNCSGYNSRNGTCQTTHYIRVDFLEKVVLGEINRLTRFARQHEQEFAQVVMDHCDQTSNEARNRMRSELAAMTRRDGEIDKLYSRMYEDNVTGKIDDERFARMSAQYTREQKELAVKIKELSAELEKNESKAMSADAFMSTVRKYTRARKLTERMLNELIESIEVHQAVKVDGVWQQKLTIHYNFIGAIEIPETLALPEIVTQTRKGVQVNYSPLSQAI